ncbi:efflux RND transporter permease subunit [Ahrensia kielensis]|uniref:Efflux RND transporter permease subunit n=1 Tax=Ahrensia kielensis TaxID=76980 RepID=A0ABU9T1P0_9HYPH
MLALGLAASDVNNQLRQTNIDMGSGSGNLAGQEYSIRTLGSVKTIEELAARPLTMSSGRTVRLGQIGKVFYGSNEVTSFALLDGQPVVSFSVYRATGASDLDAGDAAKEQIAKISQSYPNSNFTLINDATVYTQDNYVNAMDTLYEGAALAIIVVLVFLKNWRATLITAVALPLSVIPTFIVMHYLGFSLNTVSLLGITLVTGILVDDAIVEIENIVRHIQMGKPAYEASEEAAVEIGLTVIAISFTIVAVFVPVSFMSGIAGQYFKQFGLTVAVAVLFSLLVARLITPMMAAYFLKDGLAPEVEKDGTIMRSYMGILKWTLHNRTITLILGLSIFGASVFSTTLLPKEFVPAADTGQAIISLELPPGSTLDQTRQAARDVSRRVADIPEVKSLFVDGNQKDSKASITLDFGSKSDRVRSLNAITQDAEALIKDVPDIRVKLLNESGARDIQLSVLGDSVEAASKAALELANQMSGLASIKNASTSASIVRPEIQITPKPELAAELGVTLSALASTIRIATIGDSGNNAAKFNTGERQLPIIVRMEEKVRNDLFLMSGIRIPSTKGTSVPLGVIADVALSTGPSSIERYDRQYRTSVEADLAEGALLGPATESIYALSIVLNMPEGTAIQSGGDAEAMGEVFSQFGYAMGAGLLLVYVVLVLLFSSFLTPVTILLSLPLAIGGAIFALYLNGSAIGLSVIIGFLMLMGIVTKNAIMLVEFALVAMENGVKCDAAMLDAGHKRARPIIMTTIAMTAGMIPSALAMGAGGEFRAPMAIAVIGGLLLSTLLSLLFVPSLFSVVNGLGVKVRRGLVAVLGVNQPEKKTL